jgi:ATP-dependent helicase/nuclease subunit B
MSRLSAEIENAFRSGALVLTANLRAARWLRQEYALHMRRSGKQAWNTPPIEDWDTWVKSLWHESSVLDENPPLLLTDLQERQVWLRMQRDDANLLVSPDGMARLAAGAYELLCGYEAHAERNHHWEQTDAERFQQWAAAFDRECLRQRWLSRGYLENQVASAIHDDALSLPRSILLIGFDRFTPAQERLLAAVKARGSTIESSHDKAAVDLDLLRSTGLRDEITVCAWWIRQLLETQPHIRIGIVTPDLAAVRGQMVRIFRRVLMPETDDIAASASAMPFEFSLGQPLADVPLIKAALLLLRWAAKPLREEEVSWLLLSGFLTGAGAEVLAAARFDASLREAGSLSMEITLPALRERLHSVRWTTLDDLYQKLLHIEKHIAANNFTSEDREPSRWVDLVQTLLKQAGWPGGRRLDTAQFQAMAKWEQALEDVALLDFDGRLISFHDFLRLLNAHAEETLFAVESQVAPVQIMGALEASGQRFDALWFLGADDAAWPLRGRMHPLLPYEAQRKTQMPHSTPETDFELSLAVTKSLAASASQLVISHSARDKDGELRPSPLIAAIAPDGAWHESHDWLPSLPIASENHLQSDMETVFDTSAMIPWPVERSAGGANVLELQAACPFRAFATKRLGAAELNRSDWGLTPGERGDLLHKVLEKIWSPDFGVLHTLDGLLTAKREQRLRTLVEQAIAEVFAAELGEAAQSDPWLSAYIDSERRTLCRRIEEWLEVEATRVPFTVIACEEKLKDVSVGGLKLSLRADRIDEVADYKRLLIDYKTGLHVSTADWNTPRPNQPQLPLYASFGNVEDVRGVLFARLRAGETCFVGKVADANAQLFAGLKGNSAFLKYPYTNADRDAWSEALISLAHEFLRGDAAVDPKDGRKTCEHCPLPGLCRVAENPVALEDEDTESDDV